MITPNLLIVHDVAVRAYPAYRFEDTSQASGFFLRGV